MFLQHLPLVSLLASQFFLFSSCLDPTPPICIFSKVKTEGNQANSFFHNLKRFYQVDEISSLTYFHFRFSSKFSFIIEILDVHLPVPVHFFGSTFPFWQYSLTLCAVPVKKECPALDKQVLFAKSFFKGLNCTKTQCQGPSTRTALFG